MRNRMSIVFLSVASTLAFKPTRAANLSASLAFVSNKNPSAPSTRTLASSSSTSDDSTTNGSGKMLVDPDYPGTAVERMNNIRKRVQELANGDDLNQKWEDVRRQILWAGGLKDLPNAVPGQGYTGHSFNDFNHVDLTAMVPVSVDSTNSGEISGIARGNFLGAGIRIASLPELGPGGSWSTCALGCAKDPPSDVAHIQFKARIAFKLVWVPNDNFDTFVLVDDDGNLLASGKPSDGPAGLPSLRERQYNYQIVTGSKYAKEAEAIARKSASS